MNDTLNKIDQYIRESWERTVRTEETRQWNVLPLPKPFNVPCIDGNFQFVCYWDTHFINLGLLAHGEIEMAQNNVDNLLWLVREYGYIPNSTAMSDTNRSQPPYLSMMVRDLYNATGDKKWLASAVEMVKEEYAFWMEKRMTLTGLNRHFHCAANDALINFQYTLAKRLEIHSASRAEKLKVGMHYLAEAETGWDFTPRFQGRCADFLPVDLNSNLYFYETNFAWFSRELGQSDAAEWDAKAESRRELMNQLLWNEEAGLFMDCDFVNGKHSPVKSLASFQPLWVGVATGEQAQRAADTLPEFEHPCGLSTCVEEVSIPGTDCTLFQWGFPTGWAPLHHNVVAGLDRYELTEDADRIAEKFLNLVAGPFEETGMIWEKYDVRNGELCHNEYPSQDHLGWTAGVFVTFKNRGGRE